MLNLISICIVLEMWTIHRVPAKRNRNDKRFGTKTKEEKQADMICPEEEKAQR